MAGLLAAAVCAKHFTQVWILEKDALPGDKPTHRKGIPQDRQLHILLSKGFEILQTYFPKLRTELERFGAIRGDIGQLLHWHAEGDFRPQCDTGLETLMMSRPLLEDTVRRHLLEQLNVRLYDRQKVNTLQYDAGQKRITGVQTDQEYFSADLVIDATGYGGRMLGHLEALGFKRPRLERVKVGVKYTSCLFPRHPDFKTLININSEPPKNSKHGSIQPIEDNKMIVMVQGRDNDTAPNSLESFKAYTRQLEHPAITEMIEDLDPIGGLSHYQVKFTEWWHYEELRDFPGGYLPIGDTICRLNPVYGQGMTSAALQSEVLDKLLSKNGRLAWKQYFKEIAQIVKTPWEVTVMEDFKFSTTEGIPPKLPGLIKRYFTNLSRVMNRNPRIFRSFVRVLNLEAAPTILFAPAVAWNVWKELRRER